MTELVIQSYGGGTNSTAALVGMHERGERPDMIVMADTAGEKPHTYRHLEVMREWCRRVGFPNIVTVKGSQPAQVRRGSLEAECVELETMPSKVFGFGTCSEKWKVNPQEKWYAAVAQLLGVRMSDLLVLVGYDADEPERAEKAQALQAKRGADGLDITRKRYPLIEWDWGRDECVAAIARAGLPQPGKSACFFCPSSKKHEVIWLAKTHPDLFERAVHMEQRALAGGKVDTAAIKGLGRHWSWKELVEADRAGLACDMSDAGVPEVDCGCYDGAIAIEDLL